MGILFLALLFLPLQSLQLLNELAIWMSPDHQFCLSRILETKAAPVVATMICGEPLQDFYWRDWLARTGLFHIVIVAGVHWTALALLFDRFCESRKSPTFAFLLGIFLLMIVCFSGFPAPLIRSLLQAGLLFASRLYRWNWTAEWVFLGTSLLCLLLSPLWIDSLSLLHSLGCGLAFHLCRRLGVRGPAIFLLAYVLSLPLLWGWAQIHPVSLIISTLLSPILLLIWWGISAFTWLVPSLQGLWAQGLVWQHDGLQVFLDPVPTSSGAPQALAHPALWGWVMFLWISSWLYQRTHPA